MARPLLGTIVAYQFIKMLSTPWKNWDINKLGLIDDQGKQIKKATTSNEKAAMNFGTILVMNMKRMVEKLPFGKTRVGSLAAALFLLKEHKGVLNDTDFDLEFAKYINISELTINESNMIEVLPAGKYVNRDTNAMYIIEDTEPFAEEFHIPLFELKDVITKERAIVSATDIRRLN